MHAHTHTHTKQTQTSGPELSSTLPEALKLHIDDASFHRLLSAAGQRRVAIDRTHSSPRPVISDSPVMGNRCFFLPAPTLRIIQYSTVDHGNQPA